MNELFSVFIIAIAITAYLAAWVFLGFILQAAENECIKSRDLIAACREERKGVVDED